MSGDESQMILVLKFKSALNYRLRELLENRLSLLPHFQQTSTMDFNTLEGITQLTIQVEVDDYRRKGATVSINPDRSQIVPKNFSANQQRITSKRCRHHPNATSHWTSECRNPPKTPQSTIYATPSSKSYSNYNHSNVTCFKCNQRGHYANNCQQKSSNSSGNNRAQSTWTSAPPHTTTAPLRHSERTNFGKPPERYDPSTKQPMARSTSTVVNDSESQSAVTFQDLDNENDPPSASNEEEPTLSAMTVELKTIPETVFLPTLSKILFSFKDFIFPTLMDSGANCSFIDQQLIKQFNLPITPSTGHIQLAHPNTCIPRIGKTNSIRVNVFFMCPKHDRSSITIDHKFEVMKLPSSSYQFIIGSDLVDALFPDGYVPTSFLHGNTNSPCLSARSLQLNNSSHLLLDEIEFNSRTSNQLISKMEGFGGFPEEEFAEKTAVSHSTDNPTENEQQRKLLLNDPDIVEALLVNEAIGPSSFCNLPESTVKLIIDSNKVNSLRSKQYPIANTLYPYVDEIIQRWLSSGKICLAPPNCQFNNPLTVAPKKDADGKMTGIRVCLDTRKLNEALIVNDYFPIPPIRSTLETFAGCRIFGEFDLAEAYLQFKLDEDSRPLTAFTWKGKQHMFIGCPFGLSLLPSHFQRVMSFLFSDLSFTFPYLDNLPFGSATWQDHKEHMLTILHRLNTYNLYIKPASVKCGFSQMKCLGHVISQYGVSINQEKLQKIMDWPLPRTGEQLQKFLGFVTFLRAHVRHFADLTASMEAVKNNKEIIWTDHLKQQFELTKMALQRAPILKFPDFNKRFCVASDASNTGIGAVLFQPSSTDNIITPDNIVSICSRKLTKCELNYPAYKKELLAIVYAFRQFHTFIWGRNDVTVLTDHKPLIYMLSSTTLSPALQQWIDLILDYKFKVEHRPGKLNVIPDQLSRLYSSLYPNTWGVPNQILKYDNHGNLIINSLTAVSESTQENSLVSRPLAGGRVPADSTNQTTIHSQLEAYLRNANIPPIDKRSELIKQEHAFGHFGREAIIRSLWKKGYWWPKMRQDIQNELSECDACTRFVVVRHGFNPASFIDSNGPWDHIQIDSSVHLPPSPDGYTALLVVIDVFTGFVILRPLQTTSAQCVAKKLWNIFCIFGVPKIIQSDNGPEFCNDIIRSLAKLTGMDHRYITPYNPRCDGKVERAIGTTTGIIKKLLHGSNKHWPMFVPFAQLCFNQKVSSLTKSTPFSLMFGRQFNELKDYTSDVEYEVMDAKRWTTYQHKILSIIYPATSEKIKLSKDKMMQSLNKHRRTLLADGIPPGATVMLADPLYVNDPGKKPKWEPKYIGPYTVIRRSRNGQYVLRDATGDILDRHVPADQLKMVSRRVRNIDRQKQIYEVDRILDHRGDPSNYEYLVKWKNYDQSLATWEKQSSFLDNKCIANYWKSVK